MKTTQSEERKQQQHKDKHSDHTIKVKKKHVEMKRTKL